MLNNSIIPQEYRNYVGQVHEFSGGLFSGKKNLKPAKYKVLDVRVGDGTVVNVKELREKGESSYEHPTMQFLLKNDTMKRAQWSRPFPIREINLKKLSDNGNQKN